MRTKYTGFPTWEQLKARMVELDWTEQELANRAGVPQPTVHRIITGDSKSPRVHNILRITNALGLLNPFDSVREPRPVYGVANIADGPRLQGKVPLISWTTAGGLSDAIEVTPGQAEDWLDCPFKHSSKAFCLKVIGESMWPEYQEGEVILVEPELEPMHGDDVVVRTTEGRSTFKRLNLTPDGTYLLALNPDLPNRIIEVPEDTSYCGVVTGSWRNRRKR